MKIRLINILILVIDVCSSENSVYDWHIKTIDHDDTDFGDDLKMQTALNNERQQDLLKFSGHTSNVKEFSPNYFYNHLNKYKDIKNSNSKNNDVIGKLQNLLKDPSYKNHEVKGDLQTVFDEIKNFDPDENCKHNISSSIGKDVDVLRQHSKEANANTTIYEKHNRTYDKNGYNMKLSGVDTESFVGTNLFESHDKKCFSSEDVALLAIRRDFEILVPQHLPESLFDDRTVAILMNYFYICHQMVTAAASHKTRHLVQKAFYDTLGGYLNFNMVPVAKYSFYAGQISLNTAEQVLLLHEESKNFLNTNGNGWKAPLQNTLSQLRSVHIEPLHFPELNEEAYGGPSFCMQLDMSADENQPDNDKMIVQLPKIEAENIKGYLGNIWLPFSRKKTFDLKLESCANIVAKFFEIVTKCYRFEHIDQEFFNQKFKTWLMENIDIHLSDEEFYPGLGAVLRISEYLKGSQQQVMDKDLRLMLNLDEKFNKYRSYKMRPSLVPERNQTKHYKDSKKPNQNNFVFSTSVRSVPKNKNDLLRTLDFSTPQLAIIAIPTIVFLLVVIVCCWKCCCKKRKTTIELNPMKSSDTSSSNLFKSPVRFFRVRKKSAPNVSAVDYSSNENRNKKNKKSVKIDQKPLISVDTSASSSPGRKIKSKEFQGGRGKGKSQDKTNVQY